MSSVFICHRGADESLAGRLAGELRDRGHTVWFAGWHIGLGDSVVGRMNDGLSDSQILVFCFSGAGSNSPWMSREWMSALARQLDGADVRLLPVRLSGGVPPAILADLRYADLSADWDGGLAALLAALE